MALTLGAAAVTVAVILGVLVGPGVVDCYNAPGGMGQCLQTKLRDTGLLPGSTAPEQVEASATPAQPVATPAPAADAEVALVEPELDVVPVDAAAVAAAAAPENLIAATFGLLRAEPDGSVVIAGSGTPGSEIEVYSNGVLLGKTTVENSGDWVLVPDVRIAPGGTEITLGETGKEGIAKQSFVVAINEDKTSEPLVVASTPGAVSEVLQGLPQSSTDTPAQMAAADTITPTAAAKPATPAAPAIAETPVAPAVDASVAVAAPANTAAPATTPTAPAAVPTAAPATAAPAPAAAPAASTAAATPSTEAVASTAEPADPAPAATPPADVEPVGEVATATDTLPETTPTDTPVAVAAADPAPVATAPVAAPAPAVTIAPTIDAVEVEGDKTFFAGSGANGATIRLYVDDAFIADAPVATGRWLIEAGKVLTKPSQRVRIDMLQSGGADVVARAEVDFFIDLPASETPAAVAQAPGSAETSPQPAVAATVEATPAEPAIPAMVAVTVGSVDDQRFAAGKAIIRRGDNLWTIARRVYGEGVKYTTIYEANTGQIRDPDWIYPGQVFNLPTGANN